MTAGDVVNLARAWGNDTASGAGQRFSDGTLLNFTTQAEYKLMRDVLFPACRISIPTVPNQQEYQVNATVLQTDSVYLNGQLCVPSDVRTLEGHQIGLYDQGRLGANPAPVQPGSGLPPSTAGPFAPYWGTVTPQGYPVSNWSGFPAPDAVPSCTNQRPRYYWRGATGGSGYIGVTPAPSMSPPLDSNDNPIPNLVIDGVCLPPPVANLSDPMVFPPHFCEALAWNVVLQMKLSDDTNKTSDTRNFAMTSYRDSMRSLRMWVATFRGDAPDGPKFQSSRGFYSRGPGFINRRGDTGYP
jgi:hypothetical protein